MPGLDFLYSPNSQAYEASQQMTLDQLNNTSLDLNNQTKAATLPGVVGQSQSLAAQGQLDQTVLPDRIAATQQGYLNKMDEGQLQSLSTMGEKMSQMGAYLETVPPLLRPQAAQQMGSKFGIPFSQLPGIDQIPPEQLPQALKTIGSGMATASAKHLQSRDLESQKAADNVAHQVVANQGAVQAAGVRADANLQGRYIDQQTRNQVEQTRLQGVLAQAQARIQAAERRADVTTQAGALAASPDFGTNPEKQRQYRALMQTAMMLKQATVNTTNADVMGGNTPQTPQQNSAQQIEDTISSLSPKTPDSNPAEAAPADPQTIKQAFGEYDPKKYDYAIVNGKAYRKAKK